MKLASQRECYALKMSSACQNSGYLCITTEAPKMTTDRMKKTQLHSFAADEPALIDRFKRATFAKSMANALRLPSGSEYGLVVGIEGNWGTGKSTLINLIKENFKLADSEPGLAEENTSVVIDFRPWMISGSEGLVEALITQLAATIGTSSPSDKSHKAIEVSRKLLGYAGLLKHLKHLKYIPGGGWLGNIAQDIGELAESAADGLDQNLKEAEESLEKFEKNIPKLNLAKKKEEIANAIKDLNRPIIVIVDDLDRLVAAEIRSVLLAIKAVADFPRVSYLLAYDATVVARALADGSAIEHGRSYLEKIVQVSYPLPPIFLWQMQSFVAERLNKLSEQLRIVFREDEKIRWETAILYVSQLVETPRGVARLMNRLLISLPATRGEINAADVLVFEALSQRCHTFRDAIRHFPEDFVGLPFEEKHGVQGNHWRNFESNDQRNKADSWKKHFPVDESRLIEIQSALCFLFPMLADDSSSYSYAAQQRIADIGRLVRLFALSSLDNVPEAADMHRLLKIPESLAANMRAEAEKGSEALLTLISWIASHASSAEIDRPVEILEVLAAQANSAPKVGELGPDAVRRYSSIVESVLHKASYTTLFEKAAALFASLFPLCISEYVIANIAREHGIGGSQKSAVAPDRRIIKNKSDAEKIVSLWCKKMSNMAQGGGAALVQEPDPVYSLSLWYELSDDRSSVVKVIERFLRTEAGLTKFVDLVAKDSNDNSIISTLRFVWNGPELATIIEQNQALAEKSSTLLGVLRGKPLADSHHERDRVQRFTDELKNLPIPDGAELPNL